MTTPAQAQTLPAPVAGSRKERPILFSGPMVQAILAGRKTQTRRIVNPQPSPCGLRKLRPSDISGSGLNPLKWYGADPFTEAVDCPYGSPGDRLWVRETWCAWDTAQEDVECDEVEGNAARLAEMGLTRWHITYKADPRRHASRWRPSIFMPRWASRITLEIVAVRVERLQDISNEDCFAEGLPADSEKGNRTWYGDLWETINGKGSWDLNPWVWVVEFKTSNTERSDRRP